jgi:beta-aspartyl-dipeptidase (metallo-type)
MGLLGVCRLDAALDAIKRSRQQSSIKPPHSGEILIQAMFTLIQNADVYTPEPIGRTSVLLANSVIAKVGEVDRRVLDQLNLSVEFIDASGAIVVPGLIDPHQHLLGGSGEEGFSSQSPEISASEIVKAGITTVVGCLGVDTTMKTMAGLLARAKALKEEGLSAFIWSGGYNVPPTTITSSPRDDIMFIDEVIGAGEIAISDERSTDPTLQELARLVNDAYVGGMLSKKSGVTHFHVGDQESRLKLLFQLIDEYHTPPECLYPTHVERTRKLLRDAIDLTRRGSYADFDTAGEDLVEHICFYFENGGDPERLTLSSDAGQKSPSNLLAQVRRCKERGCIELSRVLSLVTKNTARVLKLADKGEIAERKAADVLILDAETLELKDVIARGKRLVRDGNLNFSESYLEKSDRYLTLVGAASE